MDNVNLRYVLTFITLATEVFSQYLSNDINGGKGPRVVSMAVRSDILYRFAETVVTSTVVNELYDARETTFDVNLPMDAFTSNFTLEVDGVSYNGEVKEKQQARQTYDKAKRKGQTAAHMFYNKPRDTNSFRVTINIAAQSQVTFVLTYNELLKRKRGHYEHIIYIDPNQVVDQLLVEVYISESREITALRIPPVRNDILENAFGFPTTNELALVERPSPRTAYIRYNPSPAEQARDSSQGISGMFKVQYDVERSLDAGDMYIVDGYFVHFFAPVGIRPLRKRILFVLDVSGSMSFGRKIMQVKEAMTQVLTELKPEDLFNIVTFESISHAWSPTMRAATMENLVKATDYVQNLKPLGGTNVNDAMIDSIKILQDVNNVGVDAPIIVFLTDGDPTVGVTNFGKILNNVDLANREKIQIFSLAFGEDANFAFLKKISARNNAFARKIYVDSDATLQLTGFYNEISNVLLSKISFTYLDDTVNLTTVTQTQFPSFFEGSELVISGQLNELDDNFNAITMQVIGSSKTGVLEMSATTKVIENSKTAQLSDFKTRLDFSTIVKKTWAYLTIKKLLLEELKTENHLLREDLRHDAVRLAIKFNFVTPVTSMVVIKPEEKKTDKADHNIQEDDAKALDAEEKDADPGTAALNASGTKALTATLKDAKALADSDPHFIVNVKGLEYAICFDVMGVEGDVYQLINDKYSGLQVNAKVVANKDIKDDNHTMASSSGVIKTFLGEIIIKRWKFVIKITPKTLTLMGETVEWTNGTTLSHGKTKIVVDQAGTMVVVIFNDRVALLVMRHLKSKALLRAGKVNFLGFYIVEYKGLSYHTHGLLGQFLHRNVILKKTKNRKGKLMGRLRVSGNIKRPRKVMATLGHRLNMATNSSVSCWMVQHNGGNLLDGNITDYLLRRKHSKESSDDDEDIADDVETEGTTFSPDVNKQTFNNEIDVETEGLTTLEADSFDKDVTDTLDYDDELNEDDENSEMISLEQDEKDNDIESDDTGSLKM